MAVDPKKMREIALQLLFSKDMGDAEGDDLLELIMKELKVTRSAVRQGLEKVERIQGCLSTLDEAIAQTSKSYDFSRIPRVERNILRLGVFELMYEKQEIPPKVAISEAIRLAKKFATPESTAFINAVLDCIYKSDEGKFQDGKAVEIASREMDAQPKIPEEITIDADQDTL